MDADTGGNMWISASSATAWSTLVRTSIISKHKGKVITPDGETDFFPIHAGVLQGDTLAPYLFAIAIDYVMRRAVKD